MKLKTITIDGVTYAVTKDGFPVYEVDGKEVPFDAARATEKIATLNGEAMGHRTAKETAEAALKKFEAITDPAAALKALETVANIDAGQLVAAGKVEEIKAAAIKAAEEQVRAAQEAAGKQIEDVTKENGTLRGELDSLSKGYAFTSSKFVTERVAVPPGMLQATYGDRFKREDGKLVAYNPDGTKVYSVARPGELADFDEAIEHFVSKDPYKDTILKGNGKGGSGADQPGGGDGKTMTRAEFDKLPPADQATAAQKFTFVD